MSGVSVPNVGWLFPSRRALGQHIGTRQYARLIDKWGRMINLEPSACGTHSLRRTEEAPSKQYGDWSDCHNPQPQ
ncbi:hypothetical protein JOD31_002606 [Methylopila capsulata]|uniref:Uncharacterized protein n=1 Tax=Methylopila capsulata TaxID=61654 RepID=A0ABS2TBD1_9HYPH|nr:hypothetical protein [Methylopila capsulata]